MTDHDINPVQFGALTAQVKALEGQVEDFRSDVKELREDVKELLAMANRGKGGLWVIMGVASTLGAAGEAVVAHIWK